MMATRSHSRSASSIKMRREKHGLAAIANAAHEIPDRAAGLRIEAGRELVEKDHFGVVDERERDEQPLLLSARERHEPRVGLAGDAELLEQPRPSTRRAVERRPEADGFAHLDAFLELRFLQLDANASTSATLSRDGSRPSTDTRPASGARRPSIHSIAVVLPAPFGPMRPKISPSNTSRDASCTARDRAVGFRKAGDIDDTWLALIGSSGFCMLSQTRQISAA